MKVHIFGASSSPSCTNYGLRKLAVDYESEFGTRTRDFVMNDFYVDDGLTSCKDEKEAIELIRNARELCLKANVRLHKFTSNSQAVIDSVPESERVISRTADITLEEVSIERALGIQWSVESDEFKFAFTLDEKPRTRRGILSTVASIYDPLGYLAPFTLIGKLILQDMCKEKLKWDDPLTDDISRRWDSWLMDLPKLTTIRIQRWVEPHDFGKIKSRELHHFSDASTSGYGQCSYLRLVNDNNEVFCTLIMAKARVAPTKIVTIPRLELTAAVLSVKISKMLKQEMKSEITREMFWTDSKIVLGYLRNEARRFHVFVANRVQQIKEITTTEQWCYVNSEENPADHSSRGLYAEELETSGWFKGPKFLWNADIPLLQCEQSIGIPISLDDPEVKKAIVNTLLVDEKKDILLERLQRYSKWSTAISAISRLRRVCQKSKHVDMIEEKRCTEILIIKKLQHDVFKDEINSPQMLQKRSNRLHKLDPFIDESGILRVGGRLRFSGMSFEVRHPAILPRLGHITELIIDHYHEKVCHQGRGFTTNEIRSNGYWILGMSRAVSSFIHKCVTCRKLRGSRAIQKMADLPEDRTEPSPAFTHCGIDCFGPFIVKDGRKELKRYGLLITCMASRAIHIEMLNDMSTDTFINALRCFTSLRGPARTIRCDRGTNFVGASNELKQAINEISNEAIKNYLMKHNCEFRMNTPYSSHMGGAWERQIRTVRSILTAILQQHGAHIDSCSLRTYLYEVMTIINSRPLTTDNLNEPNGLEPLTPNHLIMMKSSIILPPPGEFERVDLYGRKQWRKVQFLTNEFWHRWKGEYLQRQQQRPKWHEAKRNVQVDDIVILHDDNMIRGKWRLGKVIETKSDNDKLVRKVKVLVGDRNISNKGKPISEPTVLDRPVHKLTVLIEN